jgi:hypothetical protein
MQRAQLVLLKWLLAGIPLPRNDQHDIELREQARRKYIRDGAMRPEARTHLLRRALSASRECRNVEKRWEWRARQCGCQD